MTNEELQFALSTYPAASRVLIEQADSVVYDVDGTYCDGRRDDAVVLIIGANASE